MQAKCVLIKSRVFSWLTLIVFSVFSVMPFPGYAATEWEAVVTEEGTLKTRLDDSGNREWLTEGNTRVNVGSFNQGLGETWNFKLGGGDLMVNVNGGERTVWSGTTNVFDGILGIFNLNGIHFTDTSRINLTNAGFIGAAMRAVDGSNFSNLKLQGNGYVLNEGQMRGGEIALLGGAVENRGIIEAPLNQITLAGGKAMTVGLSPDNLISVVVDELTDTKVKNFAGIDLDDQIKNSGNITGHKITLDAKGVDGVFEKAINLTGEIQAKAVEITEDGEVRFIAGEIEMLARDEIHNEGLLKADKITMDTDEGIYNRGTIDATEFREHGYTFVSTGILKGGKAYFDNTDGYAYLSGSLGMDVDEDESLEINGDLTLTDDVTIETTGTITMNDGISIDGDGFDLTLKAGSGQSILRSMDDLGDLILSAKTTGTQYTLRREINMSGDLTVNSGVTLDGGFSATVGGGDVTGGGIINLSGGTFKVIGNGSFGGSEDWTFGTLEFGDGTTDGVTSKTGLNKITALDQLKISLKHTLGAGSSTWDLSWGGGYLTDVIQIASGGEHTLALLGDGTVRAWGGNFYGQLGDGSTTNQYLPFAVAGLAGVVEIAAGFYHSLARLSDGTVKAWGRNEMGQLGDGTLENRYAPVLVGGLGSVVEISAGSYFSLARLTNGTVKAWGYNAGGELGDGTTTRRLTPVDVSGLTDVVEISAGGAHSLARLIDGTVKAWGDNSSGQLGDGTTTASLTPVSVSGLTNVVEIAASGHSLARLSNGTVKAWGYNGTGQLGDGTTTMRLTPVLVSGLAGVAKIGVGSESSFAQLSDGSVKAWGYNSSGQLGDGTTTRRLTPVVVSGLEDVAEVVSSGFSGSSFARLNDGTVRAWGGNQSGQLGDGTLTSRLSPVIMRKGFSDYVSLSGVSRIVAGLYHTLALKSDGSRVYAWGKNNYGQLGDGTTDVSLTPVLVRSEDGSSYLTGVADIAAGENHSLAVLTDGTVRAWGYNSLGSLGDGTSVTKILPIAVSGLTDVAEVAAGAAHSIARLSDGTVKEWGWYGLGSPKYAPALVSGLSGVVEIAAGHMFSLARLSNGTVQGWGDNSSGQLGDGTTNSSSTPVLVSGLSNAVEIAAGSYHSLARLSDGTLKAWGANDGGQLGDGTTESHSTPVLVSGLSGVAGISAGSAHSLAILSNGGVWSWGQNTYGQLGDGSMTRRVTPVQVNGLNGAEIVAGLNYSLVRLVDGTVKGWGYNREGELGNNSRSFVGVTSPVAVSILNRAPFIVEGTFNAEESTVEYTGNYAFGRQVGVTTIADEEYNDVVPPNIDPSIGGRDPVNPRIKPLPSRPHPVEIDTQDIFPTRDIPIDIQKLFGGDSKNAHDFLNDLLGKGSGFKKTSLKAGKNDFELSPTDLGIDEGIDDFQRAIFDAQVAPLEQRNTLDQTLKTGTVIKNVTGNVRVIASDGKIYNAQEGAELQEGDQVLTDKAAKVELSKGEDQVTVSEGSAVQVQKQSEEGKPVHDLLTLAFGKVSVAVSDDSHSSFVIQTPNGISGTRA